MESAFAHRKWEKPRDSDRNDSQFRSNCSMLCLTLSAHLRDTVGHSCDILSPASPVTDGSCPSAPLPPPGGGKSREGLVTLSVHLSNAKADKTTGPGILPYTPPFGGFNGDRRGGCFRRCAAVTKRSSFPDSSPTGSVYWTGGRFPTFHSPASLHGILPVGGFRLLPPRCRRGKAGPGRGIPRRPAPLGHLPGARRAFCTGLQKVSDKA